MKIFLDFMKLTTLRVDNIRGQRYNGASSMMGKHSSVSINAVKSNQKQFQHIAKAIRWV